MSDKESSRLRKAKHTLIMIASASLFEPHIKVRIHFRHISNTPSAFSTPSTLKFRAVSQSGEDQRITLNIGKVTMAVL